MTRHPLRCETCKDTSCVCHNIPNGHHWTEGALAIRAWIEMYGCASHSNAVSDREKALDGLDKWVTLHVGAKYIDYVELRRKIRDIRKQGEQE